MIPIGFLQRATLSASAPWSKHYNHTIESAIMRMIISIYMVTPKTQALRHIWRESGKEAHTVA